MPLWEEVHWKEGESVEEQRNWLVHSATEEQVVPISQFLVHFGQLYDSILDFLQHRGEWEKRTKGQQQFPPPQDNTP